MMLAAEWLSWPETKTLVQAFATQKVPIRFVGGSVRDALLGRTVSDIDAATPVSPEKTIEILENSNIHAIPTGIAHGTVTAVIEKRHFQITSLRKDIATNGRHATVAYTDDWKEDASRRDFTMNALYLSPEGELFDYFAGEADARAGRVVFIGDAAKRIAEDYLRILRFFRFYAHYGKTAPDAKALMACRAGASHIKTLSEERVQHELMRLLAAAKSYHAISFMFEEKILPEILGFDIISRAPLRRLEEMMAAFSAPISIATKLYSLLQTAESNASINDIALRLKLSNADKSQMQKLEKLHAEISIAISFPAQKKLIRKYGSDLFTEALLLCWAQSNDMIDKGHPYHAMLMLARQWQAPEFPVTGKDLLAHGIVEGKGMGEILRELEEAWEEADYKTNKEELLQRLKK